eukprot:5161075-Amphidinium_carterae.1
MNTDTACRSSMLSKGGTLMAKSLLVAVRIPARGSRAAVGHERARWNASLRLQAIAILQQQTHSTARQAAAQAIVPTEHLVDTREPSDHGNLQGDRALAVTRTYSVATPLLSAFKHLMSRVVRCHDALDKVSAWSGTDHANAMRRTASRADDNGQEPASLVIAKKVEDEALPRPGAIVRA